MVPWELGVSRNARLRDASSVARTLELHLLTTHRRRHRLGWFRRLAARRYAGRPGTTSDHSAILDRDMFIARQVRILHWAFGFGVSQVSVADASRLRQRAGLSRTGPPCPGDRITPASFDVDVRRSPYQATRRRFFVAAVSRAKATSSSHARRCRFMPSTILSTMTVSRLPNVCSLGSLGAGALPRTSGGRLACALVVASHRDLSSGVEARSE